MSRFATLAGFLVFAYLGSPCAGSNTCVCDPDTTPSSAKCCSFTDPQLSGNPALQLALSTPAQCTCRTCHPTYRCVVGGGFLCRCQKLFARVFESPPFSQMCRAEPLSGCSWSPYERLAQRVPTGAYFAVGSKALVDVFYRGVRIGGGNGADPQFNGNGGVFHLQPVQFDVEACRWPLMIVVRNLQQGQARDSFGIAAFYDGSWKNGGCVAWTNQMIRGQGSDLNDAEYVERMSRSSFSDVQAWPSVGVRTADPWAQGLGGLGYRQIYDVSQTGRSLAVAATFPFCQGSSLE